MPDMISKRFAMDVKSDEGSGRTVVARITTTDVDRDGDVVLPSGAMLQKFRQNPVVLMAHDDRKIPVAKAPNLERSRDDIVARVEFPVRPPEQSEHVEWLSDTVFHLFREGVLSAFSIGFTVPDGGFREPSARDVREFGKDVQRVIHRWELVEFSVVTIPSNPGALALAVEKGIVDELSPVWAELERPDGPGRLVLPEFGGRLRLE